MFATAANQMSHGSFKDFYTAAEYKYVSAHLRIGQRAEDRYGRVYRFVKNGAVALVAGDCIQSSAIVANHLANTPPAVAIGDTSFTYTPGATAGAENLYEGGFLQIDTTPGQGRMYGVDSHLAIASATAFTLKLAKDDPVTVALTTSSRVGLIANPYNGVIQLPVTTATGTLVGVAVSAIPALGYGWVQTWGPAAVLISGTPALGATVMSPSDAAGAAIILTTTNLVVAQFVGSMMQIGVNGKNNAVFLKIAA
jgi:hypothetical protein